MFLCTGYVKHTYENIGWICGTYLWYYYVQDMVQTLSKARDSMQQKIILAESTYANNLLVHVCQRGVASIVLIANRSFEQELSNAENVSVVFISRFATDRYPVRICMR